MDVRFGIVCCCLTTLLWGTSPAMETKGTAVRAITHPSSDVLLSFTLPGQIARVLCKEGDVVKAGQAVAVLDDRAEQLQLSQMEAQAKDVTQIRASEASLEQKRVDLEKLEKAASSRAATELEVEHARLEVKIAELSLDLARFEHEQAQRKYEETRARVDRMRLTSPGDGTVEEVHVEAGESVNALDEVVRIVNTRVLWIDASLLLEAAARLQVGMAVEVRFSAPNPVVYEGRVIHIAAVADAASGTLKARIEVPNRDGRPAGEHVQVMCPPVR